MADAPKPIYAAQLNIAYQLSTQTFLFRSLEGAISAKKNLTLAIAAGTFHFNIEVDSAESTIFNLNNIQTITVIDLIKSDELQLKDISWQKCREKLFSDANKIAEDALEESSFGIGRRS